VNENCSLTVVIVNQVQRAYNISMSLAMVYIKFSLCIEHIIIINSVLYKKANASGHVKPVHLWTIKQVSALAGMSLGKQHTAKKTNKLKFFPWRLSALLHHRARL